MILAELELFHSRPIAPTRRVALGPRLLPVDPPPGLGGILLGGVMASSIGDLDPDLLPDVNRLLTELERGQRIPQPRLRYRFQQDRVGLQRSVLRLAGEGEKLWFEFDGDKAAPEQLVLGAAYAAGELDPSVRSTVMATLRRAMRWEGPIGADLIASLAGFSKGQSFSALAFERPVEWALQVLGFDPVTAGGGSAPTSRATRNGAHRNGSSGPGARAGAKGGGGTGTERGSESSESSESSGGSAGPSRQEVRRRFRELLMVAHPDHGATTTGAAQRIADLTEARRILMHRPDR